MAQEKVPFPERRRSKKSFLPSCTFSRVSGLSSGTGSGGRPSGSARARASRSAGRIAAAEIQSDDPQTLAERWAHIAGTALDGLTLPLENGAIRFTEARDGRGEGLGAMDIECTDRAAALANASAAGLPVDGNQIMWCGLRLNLS